MKTSTLIPVLLCLITLNSSAQYSHEKIEALFQNKTLLDFETKLDFTNLTYSNTLKVDYADSAYQVFYYQTITRLNNNEVIDSIQFQNDYSSYADEIKTQVQNIKGNSTPPSTPKALNGPCVNMDFETGDLTGWTLSRANVDGSAPFSFVGQFPVGPGPYHQIFGGGVDPVTGIARVNPLNGNFSTRLGNGTGVGAKAARMEQTFLVDATNFMYTYSYAVIFQSPAGHSNNKLPYFTVRVFDELGNNIPCGEYSVIANSATAGNYLTTNWGGSTVLYQDWQTVFTNLSAYIGQNVTVEFTTGDCSLTGHFGYAYVDATCGIDQIITSTDIICTGDSSILTAPAGAANYLWSNGATTQSTTVYSGGTYSATLTPFQGGGCTITLDVTITEYPSPTANFSSNASIICAGDSIQFTDLSTIPNPGIITGYQWDFGDGIITPLSIGVISGVNNTTGTYLTPQHLYTTNGLYNVQLLITTIDGCQDSITFPVTVNSLPIVVAGVDQQVCFGNQVTLSGSGALSYTWDNGISNNIAFTPTVGVTTYTVTGTDINGCSNTNQVDVTVFALPNVTAGPDIEICDGGSVTLNANGAINYAWDNGITNNIAFTPSVGTVTYTVIGTDVNGCVNTDEVDITVNPLPTINGGNDILICFGNSITLNASGGTSYTWNNGVINNTPFTPAVGTLTYTVTGTDAKGCVNTDQVDITVYALPTVSAGGDQQICNLSPTTLSGNGAISYSWTNNISNNIPFYQPLGTITYTVTGTDINGCTNTDQVDVTIISLPNVVAGPNIQVCDGNSITLSGSGAIAYIWDNGILDNQAFNQAIGTITYTVTGTDNNNGCVNSDQVDVTVYALPNVTANTGQQICDGETVTLSGNGAISYQWNNGVINNFPFSPWVGTTTYTVIGTDINGCTNTDQVDVTVYALPNVIGGLDQTVCEGTVVILSGSGATNYSWTGGITNNVPFNQNVGVNQYTVTGTDLNSCTNTATITVVVNPNPIVSAGPDQTGCDSDWIILTAQGTSNLYWNNSIINATPFQQTIGTTTYIVYDSLSTGCTSSDTVTVTILSQPIISVIGGEICEDEGIILSGQGASTYNWTNGVQNNVEFFPNYTDSYTLTGTAANGCTSQVTVTVIVNPNPIADFEWTNTELTMLNSETGFINLSSGASNFEWNFGDGSNYNYEFEPTHTFPYEESATYNVLLTAISDKGCVDQIEKYITVEQSYTIWVPNSFTPDGNGVNEGFKPVMEGFDKYTYTLYIFNRWGQLVFESHNMETGWNGSYGANIEQAQDGVFTWKIIATVENTSDTKVFVGHVALLK